MCYMYADRESYIIIMLKECRRVFFFILIENTCASGILFLYLWRMYNSPVETCFCNISVGEAKPSKYLVCIISQSCKVNHRIRFVRAAVALKYYSNVY